MMKLQPVLLTMTAAFPTKIMSFTPNTRAATEFTNRSFVNTFATRARSPSGGGGDDRNTETNDQSADWTSSSPEKAASSDNGAQNGVPAPKTGGGPPMKQQEETEERTPIEPATRATPKPTQRGRVSYPERPQLSGGLFEAVQNSRVFSDSKHYVDMLTHLLPATIMSKWEEAKDKADFDLGKFVREHFALPDVLGINEAIEPKEKCREHIQALWPILFRQADDVDPAILHSSLIPLPKSYVVPGGRFREIYYWDSYFTAHGLIADKHEEMALNMTRNFQFLIQTYGHIPNGNRLYYLSRSQPPFFTPMVVLMESVFGEAIVPEFYEEAVLENSFWTDTTGDPDRRYVTFVDHEGREHTLNRNWDDNPVPREESWIEDRMEFEKSVYEDSAEFYRHVRAACESGWDFSSRWLADKASIETIETTNIIPVDLNTVLWYCEMRLAEWSESMGHTARAEEFQAMADKRKASINALMWDADQGFYFDYHLKHRRPTDSFSLAAVYPLYFNLADQSQAEAVAEKLEQHFLKHGGLQTTLTNSGQQWDAPNGWAPLQWMAIVGLEKYGMNELAEKIRGRWLKLNEKVYAESGKMVEKYNVVDVNEEGGGGEYPLQDGFGWTNGVFSALSGHLDDELQTPHQEEDEQAVLATK